MFTHFKKALQFQIIFSMLLVSIAAPIRAQEVIDSSTDQDIETLLYGQAPEVNSQTGSPVNQYSPLQCSDYFGLGSVSGTFTLESPEATPGSALQFSGELINANRLPLVEGTLLVQVYKRDDNVFVDTGANLLVDQFIAAENIVLSPNQPKEIQFTWQVPTTAQSGEYSIAYFFYTNDRFPVTGLPFSTTVTGEQTRFSVTGNTVAPVRFDQRGITIKNIPYRFFSPAKVVPGVPVIFEVPITNTTSEPITVPIEWKQYGGPVPSDTYVRNQSRETITIGANETVITRYEVTSQPEAGFYITVTLQNGDSKHIIPFQYGLRESNQAIIQFAGLNTFPLKSNEPVTVFACSQTVTEDVVSDSEIVLRVTDSDTGMLIHEYRHTGDITAFEGAYGDQFLPNQNYNNVALEVQLVKAGTVLQSTVIEYRCNELGCADMATPVTDAAFDTRLFTQLAPYIAALGLVIVLMLFLLLMRKKKTLPTARYYVFVGLIMLCSPFFAFQAQAQFSSGDININGGGGWDPGGGGGGVVGGGGGSLPPDPPSQPNSCQVVSLRAQWQYYNATAWSAILNGPGNRARNICSSFAPVSTEIIDDDDGRIRIDEDNSSGGNRRLLCLGTDNPNVSIVSAWAIDGSCPAGTNWAQVYDEDFNTSSGYWDINSMRYIHKHALEEEDSNNINNRQRWCLGVVSNQYNYTIQTNRRLGTSCPAGETLLLQTQWGGNEFHWNMNTENDGDPVYSLCARILPAAGETCTAPLNPATPTGLSAAPQSCGSNQIFLDWDDAANAASYSVYFSNGTFVGNSAGSNYMFTGSGPGQNVSFYVRANNSGGVQSGNSSTVTANTPNVCAPAAPNGLSATPQSCSSGTIRVSWNAVSGATDYNISINGGGWFNVGNVTSWNHTGLGANSGHSYRVQAWNAGGAGGASGQVNATAPATCNTGPAAPTINGSTNGSISITRGSNLTVAVRGTDPDNDNVVYGLDLDMNGSDDTGSPFGTPVPSGTTQNIGVGQWNTAGVFTIRARTYDTRGGISGWTNFTINVTPSPVAAISGSCPAPGNTATVSWPASSGATFYELRVDNQTSPGGWNGTCNASAGDFCLNLTGTSHSFSATPGHQYNTWVHACNTGGCSAPVSSVFSCSVAVPAGLTITPSTCGTNQLFLDWSDVPGATSYSIYYSNGTWVGNSLGSNFTFTGGTNLSYSFYVRANSGSVQSANSNVVSGTTPAQCPTLPNLRINGSDAPVGLNYGATANLTWTSTGAVPTCTLSGAGIPSGSQVVTANGSTAVTVTQSSLYALTCGTETDTVQVNLNPQPPNAPTINFPAGSTSGVAGTPVQFRIVSTHPNPTSQFYYTIDWDNNNSPDAPSPSPMYNTGQQWTINNTWLTNGTFTVRACARDIANALPASCANHTVTIVLPPPPSVTLRSSTNGGTTWVNGNPTINPVDSLSFRWESLGASSCIATAGAGFTTGSGNPTSGTDSVTPPTPGTSAPYTVSCTGLGGTTNQTVTVTTRAHPNFTRPDISFVPSPGFDPATGIYNYVDITFQTRNGDGAGSDTLTSATYEFQFDRGRDGYEYTTTGSIGILTLGAVFNRTERVTTVPFGNARMRVAVDIPLPNGVVTETNENDNVQTVDFQVPPPNPGLSITADRLQLRPEETTTIRWSTTATYPTLDCRVLGPGIDITSAPFTGSQGTQPITAKSEYTLTCRETTTNTTWQDSVSVEVLGELQEI